MREQMMLTLNEVTDILRQNKKKVTPQRLAVYAALAATEEHPTAELSDDESCHGLQVA